MPNGGYIKIWRSLLDWEWYDDANTLRVFLHLLLTANHEDGEWHGMIIRRGQVVTSYVRIVQNDWMEREMRDELVKLGMEYLSAEEYIQRVEAMTEKYKATIELRDDNGISSFSEAAKEFLSWLHAQHKDTPKSGFSKLDTAMGGFMEGSVFVLAARPGCGKTDFAINLAMRMATSGHRVLYFSMEMTNVQLM